MFGEKKMEKDSNDPEATLFPEEKEGS